MMKKNISNMLLKEFLIIFLFFQKIHGKIEKLHFFPAVNRLANN